MGMVIVYIHYRKFCLGNEDVRVPLSWCFR